MAVYLPARVTDVHHWSDKLFSFTTTREPSLRFENGQFLMVALDVNGRRLARAYSIASANYEEKLDFYSIKVPNGPLTSRLQNIREGDTILLSQKPTGTLVTRDLRAGSRLFMLATGTGFAPFASLMKDVDVYQRFEQVTVVRGARTIGDPVPVSSTTRSASSPTVNSLGLPMLTGPVSGLSSTARMSLTSSST